MRLTYLLNMLVERLNYVLPVTNNLLVREKGRREKTAGGGDGLATRTPEEITERKDTE